MKKDARSILLSVFNMMNLVVGGGVIGLPYAASNFGYMGFIIAILTVVTIACLTQFFNLSGTALFSTILKVQSWFRDGIFYFGLDRKIPGIGIGTSRKNLKRKSRKSVNPGDRDRDF